MLNDPAFKSVLQVTPTDTAIERCGRSALNNPRFPVPNANQTAAISSHSEQRTGPRCHSPPERTLDRPPKTDPLRATWPSHPIRTEAFRCAHTTAFLLTLSRTVFKDC